jgi:hypothetical protein
LTKEYACPFDCDGSKEFGRLYDCDRSKESACLYDCGRFPELNFLELQLGDGFYVPHPQMFVAIVTSGIVCKDYRLLGCNTT